VSAAASPPASPAVNDTFTTDGVTKQWNGSTWSTLGSASSPNLKYAEPEFTITASDLHATRNAWDSAGRHYVTVGADKLYISTNGGESYSLRYTFPDSPTRIYGLFITEDDTVLVSVDGQTTGIVGRVYRSTNQGTTFTQITTFDAGYRSGNIAFWGATQDATGIYVGQYNLIPTKDLKCIVWKSTDDGVTWTNIAAAGWSSNHHVHALGVDPATGWLYATIGDNTGGVWRSKLKNGTDWVRKVGTTAGNAQYLFIAVEIADGYVYVGDDMEQGRIWRFQDDGTSDEQAVTLVLDDADNHNVYYLKRDPSGRFWCCMPPADGGNTEVHGKIYVSRDGVTWKRIYRAAPILYSEWMSGAGAWWALHTGTTQYGNQPGGTNLFAFRDATGVRVTLS
jgi:hypothetical protein